MLGVVGHTGYDCDCLFWGISELGSSWVKAIAFCGAKTCEGSSAWRRPLVECQISRFVGSQANGRPPIYCLKGVFNSELLDNRAEAKHWAIDPERAEANETPQHV